MPDNEEPIPNQPQDTEIPEDRSRTADEVPPVVHSRSFIRSVLAATALSLAVMGVIPSATEAQPPVPGEQRAGDIAKPQRVGTKPAKPTNVGPTKKVDMDSVKAYLAKEANALGLSSVPNRLPDVPVSASARDHEIKTKIGLPLVLTSLISRFREKGIWGIDYGCQVFHDKNVCVGLERRMEKAYFGITRNPALFKIAYDWTLPGIKSAFSAIDKEKKEETLAVLDALIHLAKRSGQRGWRVDPYSMEGFWHRRNLKGMNLPLMGRYAQMLRNELLQNESITAEQYRMERAIEAGNVELVRDLLAGGASPSGRDKEKTHLSRAIYYCQFNAASRAEIVRLLLKHGADSNEKYSGDERVLHAAAGYYCGNPAIVRLLLEHGANPNARIKNFRGEDETPLSKAFRSGHTAVIRLLRKYGARE